MLDSLDFRVTKKGLEIGIYGERAGAADGHNNLSGESDLPLRQFLPGEGESFTPAIETEINRILMDAIASDKGVDLEGIETSSELYDMVGELIDSTSRAEIRNSILRNPALFNALSEAGLLDLL